MHKSQKLQPWIVATLVLISAAYSAAAGYAVLAGNSLSDRTGYLWVIIFAILVALWAKNDAESRNQQKPFEYSYFVFLLWPVVLPYHLIKTRRMEGLVLFFGFCLVYLLPDVVALSVWAYSGK